MYIIIIIITGVGNINCKWYNVTFLRHFTKLTLLSVMLAFTKESVARDIGMEGFQIAEAAREASSNSISASESKTNVGSGCQFQKDYELSKSSVVCRIDLCHANILTQSMHILTVYRCSTSFSCVACNTCQKV